MKKLKVILIVLAIICLPAFTWAAITSHNRVCNSHAYRCDAIEEHENIAPQPVAPDPMPEVTPPTTTHQPHTVCYTVE